MRLISRIGRSLSLVAVLGLSFAAVGCGEPATDSTDTSSETPEASTPETSPATDLGSEAGSDTGGGTEVPEAGSESTEG